MNEIDQRALLDVLAFFKWVLFRPSELDLPKTLLKKDGSPPANPELIDFVYVEPSLFEKLTKLVLQTALKLSRSRQISAILDKPAAKAPSSHVLLNPLSEAKCVGTSVKN